MMGVLFGDFIALAFGLALLGVAWNELRGGAMLKRFDSRGARVLGYNQFLLGALIIGYAAWSIAAAVRNPMLKSMGGTTGDPKMDEMMHQVSMLVTYSLYGGMIVIGIIVPVLTAWYYLSRESLVKRFLEETPAWVVETLRSAG